MPSAQRSQSYVARSKRGARSVTRLLPYIFLCTIGPSVTAATALYVVVSSNPPFHGRHWCVLRGRGVLGLQV